MAQPQRQHESLKQHLISSLNETTPVSVRKGTF